MWEIVLPIVLGGAAFVGVLQQARRRQRSWEEAAVSCGLKVVETSMIRSKVKAQSESLEATIEPYGNKGQFIRITVSALLPQDFAGMTVRREQLLRRGDQIEAGESEFDGKFFLDGPERLVPGSCPGSRKPWRRSAGAARTPAPRSGCRPPKGSETRATASS